MQIPNGWFIDDMLVYNELDSRGHISKGFHFHVPDLKKASEEHVDGFEDCGNHFLSNLHTELRSQVRLRISNDYTSELAKYEKDNQDAGRWSSLIRNQKADKSRELAARRELRREHCSIFLSKPIKESPAFALSGQQRRDALQLKMDQYGSEFAHQLTSLRSAFSPSAAQITPMSDLDHFIEQYYYFNRSAMLRQWKPEEQFDPSKTIHENAFLSGIQASGRNFLAGTTDFFMNPNLEVPYGYYQDGFYQSVLVLDRWGIDAPPGIIWNLTDTSMVDYEIIMNIHPLSTEDELDRTEKKIDDIDADFKAEGKHRFLTAAERESQKARGLSGGYIHPFNTEIMIFVWDQNLQAQRDKVDTIRHAVQSMFQAKVFEIGISTETLRLIGNGMPGWPWSEYQGRLKYAETPYLANYMPLASTTTIHLDGAEAIFPGDNKNLIGFKSFVQDVPQHMAVFGKTRSGKSSTLVDLLTQIQPFFDSCTIVEEGLSYGLLTRSMGHTPIIIHQDSDISINYLDTAGRPLSSLQRSSAAAFVAEMSGTNSADEDKLMRRTSLINYYLDLAYRDASNDWKSRNESKLAGIAKTAYAVHHYQKNLMDAGSGFDEAWTDFHYLLGKGNERVLELVDSITEEQLHDFSTSAQGNQIIENSIFAYFSPEDYPLHRELQYLLSKPLKKHNREDVCLIADLLQPWCTGQAYGSLVDGVSNVPMDSPWMHWENGKIPEHSTQLKKVANFLVANRTRQKLISMPRHEKKLVLFEEVSRTLDVPGGEKIVAEFYAQLAKFNVFIISATQQYSRFKNSNIRPIVIGNSSIFWFFRMDDIADLQDIARDKALPPRMQEEIMKFPRPDHLPEHDRYAACCYFHEAGDRPKIGIIHNRISPELFYVSNSDGKNFDRRDQALKKYPDLIDGIIAEANKPVTPIEKAA